MLDKFIFLDIDGVLNSEEYFIKREKPHKKNKMDNHLIYDLDESKIHMLNEIIDRTNVTIVLSSSWRIFGLEKVNQALKFKGLKQEINFSTTKEHMDRGQQIKRFITKHNFVKDFIVLDDETCDIENYIDKERIFKTSWKTGLQQYHVESICDYFNG